MEEAGFEDMGDYVLKMHNTVSQYIATRPIIDLCEETVWRSGTWVDRRWWEQEGLYIVGARKAEAAEEER